MYVKNIMTRNVACCTPAARLSDVARIMEREDCGALPVVEDHAALRLVGVVTDRDIVCRVLARGRNPLEATAGDCMTSPAVSVTPDMLIDDCCRIMEERQVRRVPVVDESGACCGIVSQADIVKHVPKHQAAQVVRDVS